MAFKEVPNGGGSHRARRGPDVPQVVKKEIPKLGLDPDGTKPTTIVPLTNIFTNPHGRGAVQGGGTSDEAIRRAKKKALREKNGKGKRKK